MLCQTVIGVIDQGIWPENPSFADVPTPEFGNTGDLIPYGPVPDSFTGDACVFGHTDFNPDDVPFTCNNKLVAARCYALSFSVKRNLVCGGDGALLRSGSYLSARDDDSHGTHVASTAAGNYGVDAIIDGVSQGIISGMAPRARVAAYKVCWLGSSINGCGDADILAAIDDAIADGVDVINYSVGSSSLSVPRETAWLNVQTAGIAVATSAGNSGPSTCLIFQMVWIPVSNFSSNFVSTQNKTRSDSLQPCLGLQASPVLQKMLFNR